MSADAPTTSPIPIDYIAVQRSPEFQALRRQRRRYVFPVSAVFLAWFLLFVFLGAYAHDLMAIPILGPTNLGIVLGLCQFVSTFVITMLYVRYSNRTLDAGAGALRATLERLSQGEPAAPSADNEGQEVSGGKDAP